MGRRSKISTVVTGKLQAHASGFGFVIPNEAAGADIYISPRHMGDAVHGDQVEVRLLPGRHKRHGSRMAREGEILRVISRARQSVVGRLIHQGKESYVAPLDERYHFVIRLADRASRQTPSGSIVVASITARPGRGMPPFGELVEVLGDPSDPSIQYRIVCHNFEIPVQFSEAARAQAEGVKEPDSSVFSKRRDFRNLTIFTIDGESARDFDDAVSIEREAGRGYLLRVHIADVAHYVPVDTPLDREALGRGTSVYFPDRVVPMLPERLSNGVCSLNPGVDRLAVTISMQVNEQGKVVRSQFDESVIRSVRRLTYAEVHELFSHDGEEPSGRYAQVVPSLRLMLELAEILRRKRHNRGALDFDLPEAEIVYDVKGEILDIVRSEVNEAHHLIEEFMILANETVAAFLEERGIPLIFRVHEKPDPAKVEQFAELAAKFGFAFRLNSEGRYRPRDFQEFVARIHGRSEGKFLSYLMLRSLKLARYCAVNHGHFGLASHSYTHFTSPIRRYPDLVVHRILKAFLAGKQHSGEALRLYEELEEVAEFSSLRERKAMEAEREIMRWLMARFMAQQLGEEYDAFVISVHPNGFFVELLDHFVERFVHVSTLRDDFYVFHEKTQILIGEETGRVVRVGDPVRVSVVKVNPHRHRVDFSRVD